MNKVITLLTFALFLAMSTFASAATSIGGHLIIFSKWSPIKTETRKRRKPIRLPRNSVSISLALDIASLARVRRSSRRRKTG